MIKKRKKSVDFSGLQDGIQRQFRNLNPNDPSSWPILPKVSLCIFIAGIVAAALWFLFINDYKMQLEGERAQEETLKLDYKNKLQKAVSLDGLKKQREQVEQYVTQLEKQLPGKAEMAALLSDINQAGLGRSLQFDIFKPGSILVKDYYAELPIELRVNGSYHDIGAFASDIAYLSRIVTLNNIAVSPHSKDGAETMVMGATVRTFRYLDGDEIQAQQAAKKGKK